MFDILHLTNTNDSRLTEFRKKIIKENLGDPSWAEEEISYSDLKETLESRRIPWHEDIWRFSAAKWKEFNFDAVEALLVENEIVSISGCTLYEGGALRIGMAYYTLKEFRTIAPFPMFMEKGFVSAHESFASKNPHIKGMFITVYPHYRKLAKAVELMKSRRGSLGGYKLPYLEKLQSVDGTMKFHNVDQHFFYYPLAEGFQIDSPPTYIEN